jgi:hypothetical protein
VGADDAGQQAAADQDAALQVGFHRAAGEVSAADEGDPVIDDDYLGAAKNLPVRRWRIPRGSRLSAA